MTVRATLAERKAELDALLRNDDDTSTIDGVNAAYDHEPGNWTAQPPVFTTCVVAGMTPDFWQFSVRLYISVDPDPAQAQRLVETLMPALDAAVGVDSHFGASNWVVEYDSVLKALVTTNVYSCGRQDYY